MDNDPKVYTYLCNKASSGDLLDVRSAPEKPDGPRRVLDIQDNEWTFVKSGPLPGGMKADHHGIRTKGESRLPS